MNFSLIFPSRERPKLAMELLDSFFQKAERPDLVECWIAFDIDDNSSYKVDEFLVKNNYNVGYIKVRRSDFLHRDYHNRLCLLTRGKYIWGLNDECEVIQHHWDKILFDKFEEFLKDKPDGVLYGMIDDGTHITDAEINNPSKEKLANNNRFKQRDYGCCFPILSSVAFKQLEYFIHPSINFWGGDTQIYKIFKDMKNQRICMATDIKVKHKSIHVGLRSEDFGYKRALSLTKKIDLEPTLHRREVERLDKFINKYNIVNKQKFFL